MMPETDHIRRYVKDTLGLDITPAPWRSRNRLPLFLRKGYAYYEVEILGKPCLLMVHQHQESPAAATLRKHMNQVRTKWDGEAIYVTAKLASYQRKRLIEQKIPFLVPGNQMYLPMLGIDLREHFRQLQQTTNSLSPATQVLVLYGLLGCKSNLCAPAELADRLGYTKMTMTRAFNELEAAQLAAITKHGRRRYLEFKEKAPELWQRAEPLLRNPVIQRQRIRLASSARLGPQSGLSALARYSMLAAPATATVATSSKQWKEVQDRYELLPADADDADSHDVEIWSYDPYLFSDGQTVDRLSLFLSLRDNEDERVQAAIEEMMEDIPW